MKHLTLAILALACTGEAAAWNGRGHMMVATIAWDHMSPAARAKATDLIKLNPHYAEWTDGVAAADRDLYAFVQAATWADEIRGEAGYTNGPADASPPSVGYADRYRHSEWHYKDLAFSPDGTPIKDAPGSNAVTHIARLSAELRMTGAAPEVRSYALVWLLHLVGDVHQPLHATARYTADLPGGDRGGNEVRVCPTSCDSKPRSLHSFWDGIMGPNGEPRRAINRARRITAPDHVAQGDADLWLQESLALAKSTAYAPPVGVGAGPYLLSEDYKSRAGAAAEPRIAEAGVRLAAMLDGALGP